MKSNTLRGLKYRHRDFAYIVRDADRLCRRLREFGWSPDHEEILFKMLRRTEVPGEERIALEGIVQNLSDAVFSTAFALQQFGNVMAKDYGGLKWFEATKEAHADV
ncbi:hypothetical protein [Limnoglobus roseus]|uniref:Uncharacterized protein n=1 Tax=Limnoglobus roseus TaxID=2598579 RepID=A0A5C1A605_9BACT|nr:hypothetical protein [Limnoglobus roseus]QEL14629.1 hypothetical protein PX52LOC_01521 [Limnoglobus roseus]